MQFNKFNLSSMTNKLIITNVIVFVLVWLLSIIFKQYNIINFVALQPITILSGQRLWTLLTSMFTHFTFWHLFVNMVSFYFIGNFVEKLIGKKRVIYLYLISGLFAGIFWTLVSNFLGVNPILMRIFGDPTVYGIGASGALFGFVGVLALLTPKIKVYMIAGPIIAIIIQYILIAIFPVNSAILGIINIIVTIYFIVAITSMLSLNSNLKKYSLPLEMPMWALPLVSIIPLIIVALFMDLPIGNMAHLGGLLAGLAYAYYIKTKYPRKTKMMSNQFRN